jgi:hypothetical protein
VTERTIEDEVSPYYAAQRASAVGEERYSNREWLDRRVGERLQVTLAIRDQDQVPIEFTGDLEEVGRHSIVLDSRWINMAHIAYIGDDLGPYTELLGGNDE